MAEQNTPNPVESNGKGNVGGCTGKGWKPGQSGNPGGKSKKQQSVSAVVQEILSAKCELRSADSKLRYEGRTKLQALVERLWERAMAKGDMQAARLLLEYGYGKPAQTVALTSDAPFKIQVVAGTPDDGSGNSSEG